MTISYNLNLPFASDYPGDDQPGMLQNTNSIATWVSIDHIGFNTSGTAPGGAGGQHKQVSFDNKYVPAGSPTDPQSILYTNSGTASTISRLFYVNQTITFPVSAIIGFANVSSDGAGLTTVNNSFNIIKTNSVISGSKVRIELTVSGVSGNNPCILVTSQNNDWTNLTFTNPKIFVTFNFSSFLNVAVLQA